MGLRFSRCEARPSFTSGPMKPSISSAVEASNDGPIMRSQLLSAYLVKRIEVCAPSDARLKWLASRGRPDDPKVQEDTDQKIITSCLEPDRKAAAALERRECRELSWGMSEAMKTADLKLRNDGSLEDFQKNVEMLLMVLKAQSASRNDSR